MRLTLLTLFTVISLFGRDNPFFPADPNEKQMISSNKVETLKPFSTQQISLPNSARAIKAIIIRYQNLDGSISNEQLDLNNAIDWHEPFVITQKQKNTMPTLKNKKQQKSYGYKFISFTPTDKSMKIVTKDKLIRSFMLSSPQRVVIDFSRDTSFKPKEFMINQAPYNKIRMGNHDKYYRIVIELDGQYRYKLQTSKEDHTVVCY
jgi:hypothetical protein